MEVILVNGCMLEAWRLKSEPKTYKFQSRHTANNCAIYVRTLSEWKIYTKTHPHAFVVASLKHTELISKTSDLRYGTYPSKDATRFQDDQRVYLRQDKWSKVDILADSGMLVIYQAEDRLGVHRSGQTERSRNR